MTPQQEIMAAYIRGEKLTVVTAREKYHTTELRRVNSRLNPEMKKIEKEITGEFENGDTYKTYQLKKISQQTELAI